MSYPIFTIEDLLLGADIEELYVFNEATVLTVSERGHEGNVHTFRGDDLDECVRQAAMWLAEIEAEREDEREAAAWLARQQAAVYNDPAIDLALDSAWQRGYEAGKREAQLNAELFTHLQSQPAVAGAAEPFVSTPGAYFALVMPVESAQA